MVNSIRLSARERALLSSWVEAEGALSIRARVILASDAGEQLASICAETGLSRNAVCMWRRRFRKAGIAGMMRKSIISLTAADIREFEEWKAQGGVRERRAVVLLALARSVDLPTAAREAGVSTYLASRWRALFGTCGISALRVRVSPARPLLRPLSNPERAALLAWAKTDSPLATKAKCLLAAAEGELITAITERLGVSASSAGYWCRQFVASGMHSFVPVPKKAPLFTPEQRLELERLARSDNFRTAARAAALLHAASGNTDVGDAKLAQSTVARWTREFKLRGAEGIAGSRGPNTQPAADPSRTLPLRLDAELTLKPLSRSSVKLHGVTVSVNHKRIDVAVDGLSLDTSSLKGARVAGAIEWKARRDDGKRVLLSVQGFVANAAPGWISVTLRYTEFFTEAQTTERDSSEGQSTLVGRDLISGGHERELPPQKEANA